MYVCVCVCVYVCMYVCMYVCLYVWANNEKKISLYLITRDFLIKRPATQRDRGQPPSAN